MKKNIVTKLVLSAFSIFSLLLFSQCKIVKGVAAMNKNHVKVYDFSIPGKEIKMIPIVHFGKQVFYDDLKEKIIGYKGAGYIVYYEQMKARNESLHLPDKDYDILRRKYRKILGGGASRKDYEDIKTIFKHKRSQPLYEDLGITSSDINADIKITDLVDQYELKYGKVVLDSCDWNTLLGAEYDCKKLKNNLQPIKVDFRNQNVANLVKQSKDKKILIVYGYGHVKGIRKLLRQS